MSLSEHSEQALVVRQLREIGVLCFSVPNEGMSTGAGHARLAQRGRLRGAPDLLVLSPPARYPGPWKGAAIEFKRRTGGTVSAAQSAVLAQMEALGWRTLLAAGAPVALQWLSEMGYPVGTIGPPPTQVGVATYTTALPLPEGQQAARFQSPEPRSGEGQRRRAPQ